MKKNLFFVLSVVKIKMSVKGKLNMKTLKEKCNILSHTEKGIETVKTVKILCNVSVNFKLLPLFLFSHNEGHSVK